jgi:hypothetical protein
MLLPKMVFSSGEAKDYDLPKNPSSLYFAQDPRTMLVLQHAFGRKKRRRTVHLGTAVHFAAKQTMFSTAKPILTEIKTGTWKNTNRQMCLKVFFPRLRTSQK